MQKNKNVLKSRENKRITLRVLYGIMMIAVGMLLVSNIGVSSNLFGIEAFAVEATNDPIFLSNELMDKAGSTTTATIDKGFSTVSPIGKLEKTTYHIGDTVADPSEFITNRDQLPVGTTYEWCDINGNVIAPPSTTISSSATDYRIKVTYPTAGAVPYYVTVKIRVLGAQDSGSLNNPFDPESIIGNNSHLHMDADYQAVFNPQTEKFELYLHLNLSTEVENLEIYNNLYFIRASFKYNNQKYTPVVDGALSTEMIQIQAPQSNDLLEGNLTAQSFWYSNHYTYTALQMDNSAEIYTYASPVVQGFTKENIQAGQYQLGTITFRVNDAEVVTQLADDITHGYTAAKDQLSGASGSAANRAEAAMNALGSGWLKAGVFNDADNTDETVQDVDIAFLTGNLDSFDSSYEYEFAVNAIPGINDPGSNNNVYWNELTFRNPTADRLQHHGFGMIMNKNDPYGGPSYVGIGVTNEFRMLERYSDAECNLASAIQFWNESELFNNPANNTADTYGNLINENLPTENMFYSWMSLTSEVRNIINAFDNFIGYRTFYSTSVEATFNSKLSYGGTNVLYTDEKTKAFVISIERLLTLAGTKDFANLPDDQWLEITGQLTNGSGINELTISQSRRGQNGTVSITNPVLNGTYLVIRRAGALPYIQKVTDDTISEDKAVEIAKAKLIEAAFTYSDSPVVIILNTELGTNLNPLLLSPGDVAQWNLTLTDTVAQNGCIDETDIESVKSQYGKTLVPSSAGSLMLTDAGFDLDDSGTVDNIDIAIAQANSRDTNYNSVSTMYNSTNSLEDRIIVSEATTIY